MFSNIIINKFREDYLELSELMTNNMPKMANRVVGTFSSGLCPELQFIGWEALDKKDIPNNIPQNGIFITFKIDFVEKSVEVFNNGHIYLSREEQKATYLAMTSMKNVAKARGVKWFRKQKFKDLNDLHKRLFKFYDNVMNAVNEYTGGYPYKEGIGWVDPSKNENVA